ncbi:acyl-CoA dehydrogenase family protein [Nocardioides marmotae]|uniref:acyl-CoA dehydrogenase family protein n=1 Tax=Nocardioides marmotae TaxID=2663857 RepID=UPI0012B649E8|nr:acyl-CoA dehydrogenase family protein [Nocardioides marmotae]MBC9734441.1 acyl-CoA dehydrogenase family protein [Nocardioides marmotae]MTB85541.1 acyl-CoA dehydrogenase [Nocardioides marmotae]
MPPELHTQLYLELTLDEQDVIAGTRRHLATTAGPQALRDRERDPQVVDRDWWRTGADLGWAAPLVPEDLGGGSVTGTPFRELGLVAHEQGRTSASGPLVGVNAALAGLVAAAADGWEPGSLLDDVVAGTTVVTWAAGDGGARWEPFAPRLQVARDGDHLVVDGAAAQVEVTGDPDLLLLSATAGGVAVQLLVPTDAAGVTLEPLVGLDLARRHARLVLDGVRLDARALVGEGAAAVAQAERQWLTASALLAADSCGALSVGFEMTMEWVTHRHTFGRPLASYQALKHRLADIRMHLESAYAVTVAALEALDAGSEEAAELVHVAQAYVGEHAPGAFSEFVQLHGGIGVTWEHDLHVHLRRVIANAAVHGAPADHQRRLAGAVLKEG